jgi:hypothetical protein
MADKHAKLECTPGSPAIYHRLPRGQTRVCTQVYCCKIGCENSREQVRDALGFYDVIIHA